MSRAGEASPTLAAPDRSDPNNGVERYRVVEIQRARLLSAMAETASDHGANNVTVASVVQRAGVSRRTFYEIFKDCEDCSLSTFEDGIARASAVVAPAYQADNAYHAGDSWRERIRASLTALLELFDEQPVLARFLVVESLGAGRRLLIRRSLVLDQLVDAIDTAREEEGIGGEATRLTAEGVVGAAISVIQSRLLESKPMPLSGLVNPLMSMIVLPYLGLAAASAELEREVAKNAARDKSRPIDPLKGLQMRLTYRTVRTLLAIAAGPGSSNRDVGAAAGVGDQGQISKLLSRLEKLGLVENSGTGSVRGEPNSWMLTKRGEEVHGAIALQHSSA